MIYYDYNTPYCHPRVGGNPDMETKNTYIYPVDKSTIIEMTYDKSPAHVDALINSVDFIVAENTAIKAAADGIVIEVKIDSNIGGETKDFEKDGNYIEIQHANGEYSEYEHLKKDGAIVQVGDKVKQGQVIGYSGNTGWMADLGPHLHFMVGVYGKTISDYQTLKIKWDNNL